MLDKKITGIEYDQNGRFHGVRSEEGLYLADAVIGDPSYFPNRVKRTGQVIRAICFMKAPIPNTNGSDSVQIIIPQRQVKRRYGTILYSMVLNLLFCYIVVVDIYVAAVGSSHHVCPEGMHVAFVSTFVETEFPLEEIKPGLNLLGPIFEQY